MKPSQSTDTISQAELAALAGFDRSRICQLATEGILRRDAKGNLPRDESIRLLFRWLRERLGESAGTLAGAKLKAKQLDILIKQRQLEQLDSVWLHKDAVRKTWADIVLTVRQKMLRIGNKLAPRLLYARSEMEFEREITAEIEEALLELSRAPAYEQQTAGS
jgi:hypothetical protein